MVAIMAKSQNLYFYSPEGLALIKHTGASVLLRAAGRALAQRDDGHAAIYATDAQGSVMRLIGHEPCSMNYTAYGYDNDKAGASLLRYSGQRKEPSTGYYLLGSGYRAFISGWVMRFNAPDSLSPFGEGGFNAYNYCAGDPINKIDPSGHMLKALFGRQKQPVQARQNVGITITDEQRKFNYLMDGRLETLTEETRARRAPILTMASSVAKSSGGSTADVLAYQGTNSGQWVDELRTRKYFVGVDFVPVEAAGASTTRDINVLRTDMNNYKPLDNTDPRLVAEQKLSFELQKINSLHSRMNASIRRTEVKREWFNTPK